MTDLPTRLRDAANGVGTLKSPLGDYGLCDEAAAEIARLKRESEISAQSLRNVQSVREHEHKRAEAALAEIERLTALLAAAAETLAWYRGNTSWCNNFGREGTEARDKLAKDAGAKAEATLARIKEPRNDQ